MPVQNAHVIGGLALVAVIALAIGLGVPLARRDKPTSPTTSVKAVPLVPTIAPSMAVLSSGAPMDMPSSSGSSAPSTAVPSNVPSASDSAVQSLSSSTSSSPTAQPTLRPSTVPATIPSRAPFAASGASPADAAARYRINMSMLQINSGSFQAPIVYGSCGDGGAIEFLSANLDTVTCEKISLSELECTVVADFFNYTLVLAQPDRGVYVNVECAGNGPSALLLTAGTRSDSFSATVTGIYSTTNVVQGDYSQAFVLYQECGGDFERIGFCSGNVDTLFGYCEEKDGCNAVCIGVGCSDTCFYSSTAIEVTIPDYAITTLAASCYLGSVADGNACFVDGMCASDICISGMCRSEQLSAGEPCERDRDCLDGHCLTFDTNRTQPLGCCETQNFGVYQQLVDEEVYWCFALAPGMPCSREEGCLSNVCGEDGICA